MRVGQRVFRCFSCLALLAAVVAAHAADSHQVPFFPSAAEAAVRQGFVRVVNHSSVAGEARITAIDDSGARKGPVTLAIGAKAARHFNSTDLEDGNAEKGLSGGVGAGEGAWRLAVASDLDIEVLSYVRTRDGFVTAMHGGLPATSGDGLSQQAVFFNPGSNFNQVSILRLVNDTAGAARVSVSGVDDLGASPGSTVQVSVPAGTARAFTAEQLEAGTGDGLVSGSLGDGAGKWRLFIESDQPVTAMSLLESPTGHIANLSSLPEARDGRWLAPLFSASADPKGRQGFLRVVNHSDRAGTVAITAFNNTDFEHGPVTLSIGANEARHFNSDDLELGNAAKGLEGSAGMGEGDWWLELSSGDLDISVMAYVRTPGGFLTSMHDLAPVGEGGTHHRVAFLNPGSNFNQASVLRVVNLNGEDAHVTVAGVDDAGASPGSAVEFRVPAGTSRSLTAEELETGVRAFTESEFGFGDEALEGALEDGIGKWRLAVRSTVPVLVMSVLENPTGHLTNLSTVP